MFITLFLISLFLIIYAYGGYPLSLLIVSIWKRREIKGETFHPSTTLIITVYNEEKRIREKIENTLAIKYPSEKLQIIVASDGSSDRTNEIVEGYLDRGVELLEIPDRGGKERAQKKAIKKARGEILVFTDVATILEPEGISRIVSNFSDPSIGCVSSEDRVLGDEGEPGGEGLYVRYEMWLRRLESKVNTLVGLSGSFFAARKEVCEDLIEDLDSDFCVLLNSVKMGLRGICDPRAIGYYRDLSDEKREYERKVRTVIRGITAFFRHTELLNMKKYGLFSYQYVCHKLLRWLVPFFLLLAFTSNLLIAGESIFYLFLFLLQAAFYGTGLLALKGFLSREKIATKIPLYFLTVNASIAVAWWKYLRGKRVVTWEPSER